MAEVLSFGFAAVVVAAGAETAVVVVLMLKPFLRIRR
jgi:hypothetical protein